MHKYNVESFNFDHRLCKAPFVRLAGKLVEWPTTVLKFDIRITQPNQAFMPTDAMHSFEHLFAEHIRTFLPKRVIDFSPMGCRTGFYLAVFNINDPSTVLEPIFATANFILGATEVPACNEVQCGNYRDHSLLGAKDIAQVLLTAPRHLL